jgi:hypothetical protein
MKKRRLALGAKTGAGTYNNRQSGSYRQLPLKIKAAIASHEGRSPTPITLPSIRWLTRPVLR